MAPDAQSPLDRRPGLMTQDSEMCQLRNKVDSRSTHEKWDSAQVVSDCKDWRDIVDVYIFTRTNLACLKQEQNSVVACPESVIYCEGGAMSFSFYTHFL